MTNQQSVTPVVFCTDVEPEFRTAIPGQIGAWDSFPRFIEFIQPLRELSATPQHFNWFVRLDAQIKELYGDAAWPLQQFHPQLDALQKQGDEVGLHTHAFRQDQNGGRWLTDHGDQAWVEHCVRLGVDAFQTHYGHPPQCFRFGDHWLNNQTVALLESLGVKYDLTIEPGWEPRQKLRSDESFTGALPDYRPAPLFPYQPSPDDFVSAGDVTHRDIWMLPITTAPLTPSGFAICNLGCGPEQIRTALDAAFDEYPLVVVVARTGDFPSLEQHYRENAAYLLEKMKHNQSQFVTAPQAMAMLNARRTSGDESAEIRLASDLHAPLLYSFDEGFHPAEGGHRWMSQQGAITVHAPQLPATLHFEIARGDAKLYRKLPVRVSVSNNGKRVQKVKLCKRKHAASLSLPLPANGSDSHISFEVDQSFTPGSTDNRELSVMFRDVKLVSH